MTSYSCTSLELRNWPLWSNVEPFAWTYISNTQFLVDWPQPIAQTREGTDACAVQWKSCSEQAHHYVLVDSDGFDCWLAWKLNQQNPSSADLRSWTWSPKGSGTCRQGSTEGAWGTLVFYRSALLVRDLHGLCLRMGLVRQKLEECSVWMHPWSYCLEMRMIARK